MILIILFIPNLQTLILMNLLLKKYNIYENQTWIRALSRDCVIRKALLFSGFLTVSIFLFELFVTFGNLTA